MFDLAVKRSRSTKGLRLYILNVVEYPVTYTKFQGHRIMGSGEEDILKDFTIHGHDSYIDYVTWIIWKNICSLHTWRLYVKFGYNWPIVFEERLKIFKICETLVKD